MKRKTLFTTFAIAVLAVSVVMPVRADQPRMHEAKANLENALASLKRATADKGGHRELAIDLVNKAISAVEKGIEYDRTHYTPGRRRNSDLDEDNLLRVSTMPDQPNMVAARNSLNNALGNLNRASVDKGGYREQAMGYVRSAIDEVNAGIEYDRTH